jgi:adenosine kinase
MARLLGMGNPLLDISADVDQEFLDKYGFQLGNAILAEEKHMGCYEELLAMPEHDLIAGGATQNSIRVCQWMLQSKPGSTDFIGCVGQDEYSEKLKAAASSDGVRVHYMEDASTATGTCAAMIKGKERSLCANLSAANNYKIDHARSEEIQKVIEAATHVYSAGFFLTVSPDTINEVGALCNEKDKVFALNLSAIFIVDFFTEPLKAALEYADFLFCNESEAEAWGKKFELEDLSVTNIAKHIAAFSKKKGKRTVVITQGADPTVVAYDGEVTEYPVPPLDKDKIIDSNGAGDAFVGGFLAAHMSGSTEIGDCVKAGNYAASNILQVSGCDLRTKPDESMAL